MKIIRINNEIHAAFKKMCFVNKVTITQGAEKLIKDALKKGTFAEVKENVFKKLQELDNTFRSWMRQQEKKHLDRITEDMISLSRNLNDLGTKSDIDNSIKQSHFKIAETFKNLNEKFYSLEKYHQNFKENLRKSLEYLGKAFAIAATIVLIVFILKYSLPTKEEKILELRLWEKKYEVLYDYCKRVEKSKDIEFIKQYDNWLDTSEVILIKQLKDKGYVYQDN